MLSRNVSLEQKKEKDLGAWLRCAVCQKLIVTTISALQLTAEREEFPLNTLKIFGHVGFMSMFQCAAVSLK